MVNALVLAVDEGYERPFELLNWNIKCVDPFERPATRDEIRWADIILFCGGEDVSVELYGAKSEGPWFHSAKRDMHEVRTFLLGLYSDRAMVGICRGSQFLRVMCGGSLHQDISGHGLAGTHSAVLDDDYVWVDDDGENPIIIDVTSTHHQAANDTDRNPDGVDFFTSLVGGSDGVVESWHGYLHNSDVTVGGVQYHPEYMDENSDGMRFFQDLAYYLVNGYSSPNCVYRFNT